jgi:hypothetical protein
MLLDLDRGEVLRLLGDSGALEGKVGEALQVLRDHRAAQMGGGGSQGNNDNLFRVQLVVFGNSIRGNRDDQTLNNVLNRSLDEFTEIKSHGMDI